MKVVVTGASGFIGTNVVERWVRRGHLVVALDDLSRPDAGLNAAHLADACGVPIRRLDIADKMAIGDLIASERPDVVVHLAAQVAVTTAIADPVRDFTVNAVGTVNLLEALRRHASDAIFLYASTNKVYGGLRRARVQRLPTRYALLDRPNGIDEDEPLDLSTPYACSKGTGDVYVTTYGATYGLRTVVFRQSCIYGTHQRGTEDQGWVAWLLRRAIAGDPPTIYGDGLQVRDLLHVDDLLDAYESAIGCEGAWGQTFNIGGGPDHALSVWAEFGPLVEELAGHRLHPRFGQWRHGDQRVYISDISKAAAVLDWRPLVPPSTGVPRLYQELLGVTTMRREAARDHPPVPRSRLQPGQRAH